MQTGENLRDYVRCSVRRDFTTRSMILDITETLLSADRRPRCT